MAIWITPTNQIDWQSASSLLKPTITLSSSTCFFHVHSDIPFFLWPSTSKSNALLKTWPSSLLNTWPYQQTLFAIANWSIVLSKPNINIKSWAHLPSLHCTLHIALIMDISAHHKISILQSGNMLHFHTELLALHSSCKQLLVALKNLLSYSNMPQSLNITHPYLILAVTARIHNPPALDLSPYIWHIYIYHI